MQTEEFRQLVYHNDQSNPRFEPRQHRVGNEICEKAETQNKGKEKKNAYKNRQHRGGG
jgi:hypothetical protein